MLHGDAVEVKTFRSISKEAMRAVLWAPDCGVVMFPVARYSEIAVRVRVACMLAVRVASLPAASLIQQERSPARPKEPACEAVCGAPLLAQQTPHASWPATVAVL